MLLRRHQEALAWRWMDGANRQTDSQSVSQRLLEVMVMQGVSRFAAAIVPAMRVICPVLPWGSEGETLLETHEAHAACKHRVFPGRLPTPVSWVCPT